MVGHRYLTCRARRSRRCASSRPAVVFRPPSPTSLVGANRYLPTRDEVASRREEGRGCRYPALPAAAPRLPPRALGIGATTGGWSRAGDPDRASRPGLRRPPLVGWPRPDGSAVTTDAGAASATRTERTGHGVMLPLTGGWASCRVRHLPHDLPMRERVGETERNERVTISGPGRQAAARHLFVHRYSIPEMVGRLDRRFGSRVRHRQPWKLVVGPSLGFRRGGRRRISASNEDRTAERPAGARSCDTNGPSW